MRNYVRYRFREYIAPQLESPGIIQLVCGNRIVIRSATLIGRLLGQHGIHISDLEHTKEGLFLAYYDLAHVVKDNSGIDQRLFAAIVQSIVTHYPWFIALSQLLEDCAISLYSKDEVLIAVYGRVGLREGLKILSFEGNWHKKAYFREDGLDYCNVYLNKFTLQNRTFIRLTPSGFHEANYTGMIPEGFFETNPEVAATTILALSRIKPCTFSEDIFEVLYHL
jgi:hypothetical protein